MKLGLVVSLVHGKNQPQVGVMREGSSQGLKQQNLGFKRAKMRVELPPALNPCQAKIHELWANGMFARQVAGSRIQVQARFGIRRGGGVSRIGVTGVAAIVHRDTLALRSPSSRVHNGRVTHPCIPKLTHPGDTDAQLCRKLIRRGRAGTACDSRTGILWPEIFTIHLNTHSKLGNPLTSE